MAYDSGSNKMLKILVIAFLVALSAYLYKTKYMTSKFNIVSKEPYEGNLFSANDYGKNSWVARPSFKANLSPRFDASPARTGAIVGSPPAYSMMGAATTPVESIVENYDVTPTYSDMGATYDPQLPAGGLTTNQVNEIMAQKFGRTGTQDYVMPESLLPVPDMRKSLAKDPSNPSTFMYDRYLFAPLKRRYGKVGVDFVRGDLTIEPIKSGWFDIPNPIKTDLMSGYFQDYIDIQQSTSVRDAVFERSPTAEENVNPWGSLAQRTTWSLL